MKKTILMTTILLLAVAMLFAVPTTVRAEDEAAQIGETPYATLDEALHSVKEGETITLLKDITVGQNTAASSGGSYTDNGKVGRLKPLVGEKITFTLDLAGKCYFFSY